MTHRIRFSVSVLAALAAGGLNAQSCPGGRDDGEGVQVSSSIAAHPTRAAEIVDSVLAKSGYGVRSAPAGTGEWIVEPRFTFAQGLNPARMSGVEHPGVQLSVRSRAAGDSAEILVGVHTVCNTMRDGKVDEEAESAIELTHALMVVSALTERVKALQAAGTDLAASVERADRGDDRRALSVPEQVGEYRMIGQHDYDDPAAGVNVRYGRDDGSYVDVYVYPGAPPECDAACGARYVNEEVDGFIGEFDEMVRRGYYERMKVASDETLPAPAGAPWVFGRHMVMDVELRGQAQQSQYYLFAYPGYKVKVRATFPPDAETTAGVRAFVDALLPLVVSGS
jgi:hypothetical protein